MSAGRQAKFYHSKAWVDCRNAYLKYAGGVCERCAAKGLVTPAEIVHHKIHLSESTLDDPQIALCFDNLEAVCRKCHGELHSAKPERRYEINEDGSVDIQ